eukprot:6211291-Pleurochrysis_carterae.AAC.2
MHHAPLPLTQGLRRPAESREGEGELSESSKITLVCTLMPVWGHAKGHGASFVPAIDWRMKDSGTFEGASARNSRHFCVQNVRSPYSRPEELHCASMWECRSWSSLGSDRSLSARSRTRSSQMRTCRCEHCVPSLEAIKR